MPLLQLNLKPSRTELRWFGGLWWPLMCAVIGLMFFRRFNLAVGTGIWIGGGLLAVLGLMAPSVIQPVYRALMRLTYPIGWCVSHVVLAVMYFLVITPVGFLVRLFHDPMARGFNLSKSTYWTVHEPVAPERYFRQL